MLSPLFLIGLAAAGALFMTVGILALKFPKRAAEIVEVFESTGAMQLLGPSIRFVAIAWIAGGALFIAAVTAYSVVYVFAAK
jgi:hypothetical protein